MNQPAKNRKRARRKVNQAKKKAAKVATSKATSVATSKATSVATSKAASTATPKATSIATPKSSVKSIASSAVPALSTIDEEEDANDDELDHCDRASTSPSEPESAGIPPADVLATFAEAPPPNGGGDHPTDPIHFGEFDKAWKDFEAAEDVTDNIREMMDNMNIGATGSAVARDTASGPGAAEPEEPVHEPIRYEVKVPDLSKRREMIGLRLLEVQFQDTVLLAVCGMVQKSYIGDYTLEFS